VGSENGRWHLERSVNTVMVVVVNVMMNSLNSIFEGTFTGGTHGGALENGGVGIAPFHNLDDLVSPTVKAELEQIKLDIIAGKLP
jgi:basic membrane protein A and related proteins